ncbi:hypothetical protein QTL97_10465 [Sporosarcina thermotolerans]|uniref:LysM domain-containing protein n=1 Tax=Sporosarcina thermotolerans TaxID=633404 RepID=A0AAW9ACI7_9BACL|nr:hypothetical protein [Sporosarcina thermotolerans]MDW0117358.1 hypothetical protein [Sporosarcina thermotolerans]WHT47505.1 hypothetical protein QNH10_15210 [Sporosarcina thermotolerans]
MRTLLIAVIIFIAIHIIRIDFSEGTIPLAAFYGDTAPQPCSESTIDSISVTTIEGDTIETLLSMYPDMNMTFVERLSTFYSLNPHLQNQEIVGGLTVKLPLSKTGVNNCN